MITKLYKSEEYLPSDKKDAKGPPSVMLNFINNGQEDEMEVHGYRRHKLLTAITWLFTFLTLGAVRLIFHWWPHLRLYSTHCLCPLKIAEKLLILESPKQSFDCYHIVTVKTLTSKDPHVDIGKHIFAETSNGEISVSTNNKIQSLIETSDGDSFDFSSLRVFELKKQRYIWDDKHEMFLKLKGLDNNITLSYLHQQTGLSSSERQIRLLLYGSNEISVPQQIITELLFLEAAKPFYVFQLFSFGLWLAYEYVSYAVAIVLMSATSIVMAAIQTSHNQKKLQSMVHSSGMVTVVKADGSKVEVSTVELVPGDRVVIPALGCTLHCDAVLLSGSCVVNESLLTGETIPVPKISLPNDLCTKYSSKEHGNHTLFCGSRVLKAHGPRGQDICAVVIRTGFSTIKGELVRSILYPTPIAFQFEEDSYKFIKMMACLASIGFVYTVTTKLLRGVAATTIVLEALDLITIIVPPALPATMAVGCLSAQTRLRNCNIFCTSPKMINVAGYVNCVCFDKTGTLTEDGLDVWAVVPVIDNRLNNLIKDKDHELYPEKLRQAMACCHSLCSVDGVTCGDPLDVKMFEWTKWNLEELSDDESTPTCKQAKSGVKVSPPGHSVEKNPQQIEIISLLPFSSNMKRMTVVTKQNEENTKKDTCYTIYSKGSPEVIRGHCDPITIPKDFERKLEEFTLKGFRVIGVAYKNEKSAQLPREVLERDLIFLGLIVFENRLKPRTASVISELHSANIRPVMVTGDYHLTALNVAKECGIISPSQDVYLVCVKPSIGAKPAEITYKSCQKADETVNVNHEYDSFINTPNATLVLTGQTWDLMHSHLPQRVPEVVNRCAVFSRMSPEHKQQLVLCLQSLGYYVGMCGDGANDCGALRAAHTGISLSEVESSVASPFTSKRSTVDCVLHIIKEGRAALVTSFAIFKYMAGYSVTQFVSVMILYSIDSNLTDMQYLFVDLFVISVFAFLLGRTEANPGCLANEAPETSLMSTKTIVSLVGQIVIVICIQFISYYSLSDYDWYEPYDTIKSNVKGPGCYENYALFAVSALQYVILALVFCKGAPHCVPLYKNWRLWLTASCVTGFIFYLILWSTQQLQDLFQLVTPPDISFRVFCITLCAANFALAAIYEFFICDNLVPNKTRSSEKYRSEKEKDI